jgi:hypothetical protein
VILREPGDLLCYARPGGREPINASFVAATDPIAAQGNPHHAGVGKLTSTVSTPMHVAANPAATPPKWRGCRARVETAREPASRRPAIGAPSAAR